MRKAVEQQQKMCVYVMSINFEDKETSSNRKPYLEVKFPSI